MTWAMSGVLLNAVGQGMVLSYPSCLIPALKDPESRIKVTLSTASWLASSVGLSSVIGFFVSSFLMEWRGRKLSHILVLIPGICGWLLIYFAHDVTTLMVGRILNGMAAGATVTLGAIIIGEYTSPALRGMFLNMKTAAVCIGNTLMHILSHHSQWRTVAIYSLAPLVLAVLVICTWPESPAWLASKKKFRESEQSFHWLRGSSNESKQEYEQMIRAQKMKASDINKISFLGSIKNTFEKFGRKDFIKPLTIILFGAIVSEATGRHTYPAYATIIIQEFTGDKSQSFYYTLCIDLIITVSIISSSVVVKLVKRRTILFTTGTAALLILFSSCIYLFLVSKEILPKENTWIPISMLCIYFVLANLACTTAPYTFLGEVLPVAHRSAGSAVSGVILSLLLMIALKVTPYLLDSIKFFGTFGVSGVSMAGGLILLYFILPETKDRTLQDIEDYFNTGTFKRREVNEEEVRINVINE